MAENVRDAGFIEYFSVLFCWKESRNQGVDTDVAVGPFTRDVACQVVDCRL